MFSDPNSILDQLTVPQGAVVCDIGAGSGHYALSLSLKVGDKGKVYAIDIQKDLLNRLSTEARARHRFNIEVIWGDAERMGGTKLASGLVDMVFVCNILFQIEKKDVFLQEVARIVNPAGSIIFVDWSDSYDNLGPHADHVVTPDGAVALFEKVGFVPEADIATGAHHYGKIFKKAN